MNKEIMTLAAIRKAFRAKKLDTEAALQELSKHVVIGNKAAETLLDEILEMQAEPSQMTEGEREVAEAWEKGQRGSNNG